MESYTPKPHAELLKEMFDIQPAIRRSFFITGEGEKGRLIHLLYQSSARSPESGLLSDWSKKKRGLWALFWLVTCCMPNFRCKWISIRPSSPRNKSGEVNVSLQDILVGLGELSSFLSLLRMAFGLTQAVSHLEQRSAGTVKYASRFIASCLENIFI